MMVRDSFEEEYKIDYHRKISIMTFITRNFSDCPPLKIKYIAPSLSYVRNVPISF